MADPYIDQYETVSYGLFSLVQIPALVKGLDPAFDPALDHVCGLLKKITDKMAQLLDIKSGQESVTYAGAADGVDPIATARETLDRLLSYAESRKGGGALVRALLQGHSRSTLVKQRPAKLVGSLANAINVVASNQDKLPEHAAWTKELQEVKAAVEELNKNVRASRAERRELTPEVGTGRQDWLKVYGAAKLQVEVVLRLQDRLDLMPEIFDDLAEIHRAPGVSDTTTGSNQPPGV